jgi:clan AA aspartic protease
MGTFTVSFQAGDLAGQKFVDVEALVDTGSTYTVLPKEVLDQLEIEQEGQRRFELGDDRIVEYPIGYARMRLNGDQTVVLVVFGPEGIDPVLGATALEHLSLAVDPIHRRLAPVLALLK